VTATAVIAGLLPDKLLVDPPFTVFQLVPHTMLPAVAAVVTTALQAIKYVPATVGVNTLTVPVAAVKPGCVLLKTTQGNCAQFGSAPDLVTF
jgi:hypothetical protein